ncbi:MAG: M15 family metallopeptidase [Chthoniobacterales bacterium]
MQARVLVVVALVVSANVCRAAEQPPTLPELVEIRKVDPTIVVDLRYASERNLTHRALYPHEMPALVRPSVAERLAAAQKFLRAHGFGLKIWDAYRPLRAQRLLWQLAPNGSYVADPKSSVGSMHTRGVAVDATLVDKSGHDVAMPTDFDDFTPAATHVYHGDDALVRSNLNMLQRAMARSGFYGLRTEWWHFAAEDWGKYPPIEDAELTAPPAKASDATH